ncbi:MAG: hypothetical protein QNK04_19030 [Myxococcota bacterium]|nr:hypothetical protein [Myxococcota bacterium]
MSTSPEHPPQEMLPVGRFPSPAHPNGWFRVAWYRQPVLCDGDGKFGVYRKWMRQFFSEDW